MVTMAMDYCSFEFVNLSLFCKEWQSVCSQEREELTVAWRVLGLIYSRYIALLLQYKHVQTNVALTNGFVPLDSEGASNPSLEDPSAPLDFQAGRMSYRDLCQEVPSAAFYH